MSVLGHVIKYPSHFQGQKAKAYGGRSEAFSSFEEARRYVNGSVKDRAKIRDVTRRGSSGSHGGPLTYEVYINIMAACAAVANLASLTASTGLTNGDVRYVTSLRGFFVYDSSSTTPIDGINFVAASGPGCWRRMAQIDPYWGLQATWYINPSTGNDENDGATSGTALATISEWCRRVNNLNLEQETTVWIEEDCPTSDPINVVVSLANGQSLRIRGVPRLELSSTVAYWSKDPPTNDPGTLGLLGWSVSDYTGMLVRFTSGAADNGYAWISSDVGAGLARVSTCLVGDLFDYPVGAVEPSPGDTAEVYSFPTVCVSSLTVHGAYDYRQTTVFDSIHVTTPNEWTLSEIFGSNLYAYHTRFEYTQLHCSATLANCSGSATASEPMCRLDGGVFTQFFVEQGPAIARLEFMTDSSFPSSMAWSPGLGLGQDSSWYSTETYWAFGTMVSGIYIGDGAKFTTNNTLRGNVDGYGVYLDNHAKLIMNHYNTATMLCSLDQVHIAFSIPQGWLFSETPWVDPHTDSGVLAYDSSHSENLRSGASSDCSVGISGPLTADQTRYALQNLSESVSPFPKIVVQTATVGNLHCRLGTAPSNTSTVTIIVLKNGMPTGLTCQIQGTSQTSSDVAPSHRFQVSPQDRLDVQVVTVTGGAFAAADLSVNFDMS